MNATGELRRFPLERRQASGLACGNYTCLDISTGAWLWAEQNNKSDEQAE